MKKIKIVFIMSSFKKSNTGIGGHYRSVRAFAEELSKYYKVQVNTVGDLPSPVFDGQVYYKHLNFIKKNLIASLIILKKSLKQNGKEEVIYISVGNIWSHIFGLFGRLVNKNSYLVYLKPGGSIINKRLFVYDKVPVVVFSEKDKNVFLNANPNRPVYLNAARVQPLEKDENIFKIIKEKTDKHFGSDFEPIVVIISRLSEDKIESLNLIVNEIISTKVRLRVLVVGQISSQSVYEEVKNKLRKVNGLLITDKKVTKRAAQALFLADYYCGIGRSALEATSLGIPTFIPAKCDSAFRLVMLNEHTWAHFFKDNFTSRASFNSAEKENLLLFDKAFKNTQKVFSLSNRMMRVFDENLSVEKSVDVWGDIFKKSRALGGINRLAVLVIYTKLLISFMPKLLKTICCIR